MRQALKASKNDIKSGAHKANAKNKQRTNMTMNKRKGDDSDHEDADEETASRESSRRPSKQDIETSTSSPVKKRQKKENAGDMKKKKDFESKSSLNSSNNFNLLVPVPKVYFGFGGQKKQNAP